MTRTSEVFQGKNKKIFLEGLRSLSRRLNRKQLHISVIGAGSIGLPVATLFASARFPVIACDIDEERVREINSGSVVFWYSDTLKRVVSEGMLAATSDVREAIVDADAIIVCVPTPLKENKEIDLSYVDAAKAHIIRYMERGTLIMIESSYAVGTTRKICLDIESSTKMRCEEDFGLAYCPERYNPTLSPEKLSRDRLGQDWPINNFTLETTSRVVGGIGAKSRLFARKLYQQIISASIHEVSSVEVAEAAKLLENVFRDVNIALINELAILFSRLNLNTHEIISAAGTKPFAFMPHFPGPGVGGVCIPVDTWYLIKLAERMGTDSKVMLAAREVNDFMPQYVVKLVEDALDSAGKRLRDSRVCLLGIAYKANIPDPRLSPAFPIIRSLVSKQAKVWVCDPIVQRDQREGTLNFVSLEKAFDGMDAVVVVTDHELFRQLKLSKAIAKMRTPILVDCRNVFDKEEAISLGFIYKGVGT